VGSVTTEARFHTLAAEVAREASRYLDVVDVFASLGADPHAGARVRAAQARRAEDGAARAAQSRARKAVR
jgi:hypothetical protein